MAGGIKKALDAVDLAQKVWGGLVWAASLLLPPLALGSPTLRWYVIGGAFVGGAAGYYFTATGWGGEGRARCLRGRTVFLIGAAILFVLTAAVIAILRPEVAELSRATAAIREFLLRTVFLPNVLAGLGALGVTWLLVGAVTLSSPKLWTTPP